MLGIDKFKNGTFILDSGCDGLGTIRIEGQAPILRRKCRKGGQTEAVAKYLSGDRVEVEISCDGICSGCQPRKLAQDVSSLYRD